MKIKMMLLLATVFMSLQTVAQSGKIAGTVADENSDPIIGAIIEVSTAGTKVATAVSDIDGKYQVTVKTGKYDIFTKYTSYKPVHIKGIVVTKDKTTIVNINFKPGALDEVVITYQKPLITKDGNVRPGFSREDIKSSPTIDMTKLVGQGSGVTSNNGNNTINPSGARSGNTITMLDGVMIKGAEPNLPQDKLRYNAPPPPQFFNPSNEEYKKVAENDFMNVKANPLSTMSIDVDRASYSNVRRYIQNGQMPPADAVRIEEMINYFKYGYDGPKGDDPMAINTELTDCPWKEGHKLLRIGMQAKKIRYDKLPASNLVFLIDVSGSMTSQDKLPLLIQSMKLLVNNLREEDRVSIVTYAGAAGLVLPSTSGDRKEKILSALERLSAGGSTAGGAGILLAYKTAQENFIKGGNNRIILATDGDFNVGVSADNELEKLITKEREKGVFLSCLGFGTGNYKDSKMEMLADKGNGNYAYIDNLNEGKKTLVNEFGGTLFTVAKDVKAQIEFNPTKVRAYRLVGYENRMLNAEDFKDDKKDAGELGAGHTVTFIYEIVPVGIKDKNVRKVNDLKYQDRELTGDDFSGEFATVKFRYKKPDGKKSTEMTHVIKDKTIAIENATENTRFAYAVALFGMLLKQSEHKGDGRYQDVLTLAKESKGEDEDGYRAEFIKMVKDVKNNIAVTQR